MIATGLKNILYKFKITYSSASTAHVYHSETLKVIDLIESTI